MVRHRLFKCYALKHFLCNQHRSVIAITGGSNILIRCKLAILVCGHFFCKNVDSIKSTIRFKLVGKMNKIWGDMS